MTGPWKFYYVTCLDLQMTAGDNFMKLLDRLTKWLKTRFPGFPERASQASGLGRVSPGSFSSLHFQDKNLVVLCFGGGIFPRRRHVTVN